MDTIYFYLFITVLAHLLGMVFFGHFEINTPLPKRLVKVVILVGGTMISYHVVGGIATLIFPVGLMALGLIFHFLWCRANSIHPLTAGPKDRYYQLRGWN